MGGDSVRSGAKGARAGGDDYRPLAAMEIEDLEILRLILRGGSVIDWRRLYFQDSDEVDHFLRLNLFDLANPRDERRLRAILVQAVEYLRSAFGYRVAEAVAKPADLRELFLLASGAAEPKRYRRIACVVLKCMHVIHHLEARELLFRTPMREADLVERVDRRVMAVARETVESGFPVVVFHGSVKTRDSLMTKLLVKKETVAAQVFDRLRYRVVTRTREQIPSVLRHLCDALFPFNFVVPGQTSNNLLRFRQVVGAHPRAEELMGRLQAPLDLETSDPPLNEFSASDYKALNFVVDIPVRIDDLLPAELPQGAEDLGRVVFSLVEFQVMDEETAKHNERGPAQHDRYKKRQLNRVLRRLSRGLVVPKKTERKV